jgi:hypothetical protein
MVQMMWNSRKNKSKQQSSLHSLNLKLSVWEKFNGKYLMLKKQPKIKKEKNDLYLLNNKITHFNAPFSFVLLTVDISLIFDFVIKKLKITADNNTIVIIKNSQQYPTISNE